MISLTRLTRWALRTAARRWPADLREELHREWQAELAHLESRPGTAGERLRFAFSLLTSPPARDAAGVPRGWAETRPALSPAVALVLVALLGLGVAQIAGQLYQPVLDLLGPGAAGWSEEGWGLYNGALLFDAVILTLWCVPAGLLLGRRLPMARDGRAGRAGPALLAPLAVAPALIIGDSSVVGVLQPTTVIGAVAWTVLMTVVAGATARARRPAAIALLAAGVPLAAAAATALATIPMLILHGGDAALAALTMSTDADTLVSPESGYFVYTGRLAGTFTAFGWLAVVYGRRAAGAPERRIRPAVTTVTDRPGLPAAALAGGVTAVVAGVLAWACTVTYLTPAMPVMSAAAPMPGGDGEIYLWVAELRWAAVLLTALGVLVATADRRSAPRAAGVVAAGLLAIESVLLNREAAGATGLRIALLAAAVVIALGWSLAGRPVEGAARSRTTIAAIAAAALGPMLFAQGTPPENHPFMPLGLPLTTVGVAAGLVLLGVVTAVATGPHRLHPAVIALLTVVPVAAIAGLGTYLGNGENDQVSLYGVLLALPCAVAVVAVLRRHRARPRGRTTAIWTLLAVAGLPLGIPLMLAAMIPLSFAATMLFAIDGTGYPADGISALPGAALLVLPAAALLARRQDGTAAGVALPEAGPHPVTGTSG